MTTARKFGSRSREANRLMDEVYREMFLLEAQRPGAEMGLALALMRAWVAAGAMASSAGDWAWLNKVGPIGLRMIEDSLENGGAACPVLK